MDSVEAFVHIDDASPHCEVVLCLLVDEAPLAFVVREFLLEDFHRKQSEPASFRDICLLVLGLVHQELRNEGRVTPLSALLLVVH